MAHSVVGSDLRRHHAHGFKEQGQRAQLQTREQPVPGEGHLRPLGFTGLVIVMRVAAPKHAARVVAAAVLAATGGCAPVGCLEVLAQFSSVGESWASSHRCDHSVSSAQAQLVMAANMLRRSLTGVVGLATAGAAAHHFTSGRFSAPRVSLPAGTPRACLPARSVVGGV